MISRRSLLIIAALAGINLLLWLLSGNENASAPQPRLPDGALVIALGDSLTYGHGATPEQAYPAILAQLTGWQVHNSGINGDTSADVLARIDEVIAQRPDLVLLAVGGNDVLRRVEPAITQRNIEQIITHLSDAHIAVLLIAQPHFSASNMVGIARDNPIYADIAAAHHLPLFADQWSRILSNDALKSDQIHANAEGYRQFATALHRFLQQAGYL